MNTNYVLPDWYVRRPLQPRKALFTYNGKSLLMSEAAASVLIYHFDQLEAPSQIQILSKGADILWPVGKSSLEKVMDTISAILV